MVAKKTTTKKKTVVTKKAAPAKKAPVKKAPAKKAASPAKKRVTTAISEVMTKTQILDQIVGSTEISRKDVVAVIDELTLLIERHIKKKSVGEFKFPGLMKIKVVKKPAVKARKGINPFNGEEMMFKAKPARNTVKILPLKALKDMAL